MGRVDKVSEAIRQEASVIIHDQLKDPRVGFVTITKVEMTPDLRSAKIYFSVLGNDQDHRRTKEALDSASGFIRRLIVERINLKFAPEIFFREDRSSEYSVRIEEVLNEIKQLDPPPLAEPKKKPRKETKREPKKVRRVRKKT
jgi:ribosome-binding factor A